MSEKQQAASAGEPQCVAKVFSDAEWAELGERLKLNGRMLAVVRAIFEDKTEYAMAQEMGISAHSVHTYLERVRRHLGVHSRVKIVLLVMGFWISTRDRVNANGRGD